MKPKHKKGVEFIMVELPKFDKLGAAIRRSPRKKWNLLVEEVNSISNILANAVDNDTIYDDTDIKSKMGYADIPADTNLQAEIGTKADSNHGHTLSNVSDLDTVEAVFTYTDDSTETVLLVKQVQSNSQSNS